MSDHDFCRVLLAESRREARENAIKIPQWMTALDADRKRQWFVEAIGMPGQMISACCAYSAKAKLIHELIDKANAPSAVVE